MDRQQRIKQLKAFLADDPDDAFTRFALAQEYQAAGDTEQALQRYESLVEEHPEYVGTYYHLGKLYETFGRTEKALATYEQGITVAEEQNEFHARSELQDARMQVQGIGFDDE